MSDGNPSQLDFGPRVREADRMRGFQFSLVGLFVAITGMAMILSAFFGVGRLVGMSPTDVLVLGLGRYLVALPTVLVWIVGLVLALRRLRRNRLPATLTAIALSGLLLTSFVLQVAQMALIHLVRSGQITNVVLSRSFALIAVLNAVLNAVLWTLILVAVFAQRDRHANESTGEARMESRDFGRASKPGANLS